jgi:FkbM family methyltransferase
MKRQEAHVIRAAVLDFAARHKAFSRAALAAMAPMLPPKWIICELVAQCGGFFPTKSTLGNGMPVRLFLGDLVGYHIATGGWYEPNIVEKFRQSITSDTVFFDVGAHIGQYSLCAAPIVRSVHAFEANSKTIRLLRYNVESNHLANIVVNHVAVCDQVGTATFRESDAYNPGASSLHGVSGESVTVPTTTLDAYCADHPVNDAPVVIKIDVEGAEAEVLRGALSLLSNRHVTIFMEVIDEFQERSGGSCESLKDLLSHHDFVIEQLDKSNIRAVKRL